MNNHQQTVQLIQQVGIARADFIASLQNVSEADAVFKSAENQWSIIDITEHLFWAEQGALYGMWKILYAIRTGASARVYESEFKDWPVQQIIDKTWQEKEQVPASAAPRLGGTLAFWRSSLASLQPVLEAFGEDLTDDELRVQAHPHPISGPLDFQQRLEFLGFHIARHHVQVSNILKQVSSQI